MFTIKEISKRSFWLIILGLIIIRVVMVVLLMNDIPHTGVSRGGWWFHHGGDEQTYFKMAKEFASFGPVEPVPYLSIGFPLYLVPFVYFFQATEINDILKPVFILHAFLLYSLAIVLIGLITKRILKSKLAGALGAGLFTFFPYIFYFLFKDVGPVYNGITSSVSNFEHSMWIQVLTDPISAFLVYLCFFLFIISLEKEKIGFTLPILLGILSGFAALIRNTNVFIIGVFLLIWLAQRKTKEASLAGTFSFLAFLPQLIYNYLFYGSPILVGKFITQPPLRELQTIEEAARFKSIAQPGLSIGNYYYFLFLVDKYIPRAEIVLIFLIALFVFGLTFLYQRNKTGLAVVCLWFMPYLFFYGLYGSGIRNVRYHFPVFPPLIILAISSLFFIVFILGQVFSLRFHKIRKGQKRNPKMLKAISQKSKVDRYIEGYVKRYTIPHALAYQKYLAKKLLDLVQPKGLILDDGCGPGYFSKIFLKDFNVIGVDISEEMLVYAKKNLKKAIWGNAENLPFPANFFDTVFVRALIHHLSNPQRGIDEIYRVLKSGGKVIFNEPIGSVSSYIPRKLFNLTHPFLTHHKNFRERQLINLIKASGLKIIKTEYCNYIGYAFLSAPDVFDPLRFLPAKKYLAKILLTIDDFLSKIPLINKWFAWGIIVVAQKP